MKNNNAVGGGGGGEGEIHDILECEESLENFQRKTEINDHNFPALSLS